MARFLIVFIVLMVSIHTTMGGIARTSSEYARIKRAMPPPPPMEVADARFRIPAASEYGRIKRAIPSNMCASHGVLYET